MISFGFLAAARYYYCYCINLSSTQKHIFRKFNQLLNHILAAKPFSVRVSHELGRGSSQAAKFSIGMTVITSFAIGFIFFIFFLFFRGRLAYIFTDSHDIAEAVADLSPLLACSLLLNSVQPVLSGKFLISFSI